MNYKIPAALLAAIFIAAALLPAAGAEENDNELLIDFGNGRVCWTDINSEGSYSDVIISSAESAGLSAEYSRGMITIDGVSEIQISAVHTCWKLYSWNGSGWEHLPDADLSSAYPGGTIAVGYYPDADDVICPVSSPDYKTVWTQFGGSSYSHNTSESYGTLEPALPVEWYYTYSTGYVNSGILAAGDLIYHTTGGAWGGSGGNGDPWVYCLNRFTGEIVWKYQGTYGAGYEVTTPVVLGDMLIVSMTCGEIICFDRFTGEVLHKLELKFNPPMNSEGDIVWDSNVFVTGAATPVYDSGALYFGTDDGKIYSYSITRSSGFQELWCYDPPDDYVNEEYTGTKGCFYFHAPTIADIDGRKMLFIGNYGGYVHALDCRTGEAVWVERVIDMSDNNPLKPGMPGSAATTSVSLDGNVLLVTCTDSAMTTSYAYIVALDPKTGKGLDGEDYLWKINAVMNSPVVTSDGFYTCMMPSVNGDAYVYAEDGTAEEITYSVCKFDWNGRLVWMCEYNYNVKAPLTLADGILYVMDYSAGGAVKDPAGHLSAVSAETGSILWSVLLRPFSEESYSMVQPTVIDGKIYVGNDYGAVYCVSSTAGPSSDETLIDSLETAGFNHWSWYVLAAVVAVTLTAFAIFYRGA